MKKKLALLMAAIMTVAMVPMTALAAASTKIVAVDQVKVAADKVFTSRVELKADENYDYELGRTFDVYVELENAKFTKTDDDYDMDDAAYLVDNDTQHGIAKFNVLNDTKAVMTIHSGLFLSDGVWVELKAKALEAGDVVAKFSTNKTVFHEVKKKKHINSPLVSLYLILLNNAIIWIFCF